jgi:glucokinase
MSASLRNCLRCSLPQQRHQQNKTHHQADHEGARSESHFASGAFLLWKQFCARRLPVFPADAAAHVPFTKRHATLLICQNGQDMMETAQSVPPGFSIGIDLRIAAYSAESQQLDAVSLRTRLDAGPSAVLRDMADAVRSMQKSCAGCGTFAGVGIGSPGPIELPEGKLRAPANLPGWDGLQLRSELRKLLNMPIIVESDANAAAFAEWRLGAGRAHSTDSMAMFTLGTGVGGGLILNGKIWHGDMGMAAEPGHTVVYPGGHLCNCGSYGCLEMYASATGVHRMAAEAVNEPGGEQLREIFTAKGEIRAHDVANLARQGDPVSRKIFEDAGTALGLGIANTVAGLNLSLYVVGGGMAQAWDLFAPAMFRSLSDSSQVYRLTAPRNIDHMEPGLTNVHPAHLGPEAGLLGAAMLPLFQ